MDMTILKKLCCFCWLAVLIAVLLEWKFVEISTFVWWEILVWQNLNYFLIWIVWLQGKNMGGFLHVSTSQYLFSNLNSNCSNLWDKINLHEQVKNGILLAEIVLTFLCLNKLFSQQVRTILVTKCHSPANQHSQIGLISVDEPFRLALLICRLIVNASYDFEFFSFSEFRPVEIHAHFSWLFLIP